MLNVECIRLNDYAKLNESSKIRMSLSIIKGRFFIDIVMAVLSKGRRKRHPFDTPRRSGYLTQSAKYAVATNCIPPFKGNGSCRVNFACPSASL